MRPNMRLTQARLVTDDVERLAAFYADLIGTQTTLNAYYVEIPAGAATVGVSRHRFTELPSTQPIPGAGACGDTILDFLVDDVDAQYTRIDRLGVRWVQPPSTAPWGNRCMIFRDPEGHPISVFSRCPGSLH